MHAAVQPSRNNARRSDQDQKPVTEPHSQTRNTTSGDSASAEPGSFPASIGVQLSEDQIQSALFNALKSPEFRSAPQLRAFLEFVVRAALDNKLEKIKGYTIAVEALGRPEDFNPVTDPIVRVEAARLRRRLVKYYTGSGLSDPVRISIPKGSYAPSFSASDTLPKTASADQKIADLAHPGTKFIEADSAGTAQPAFAPPEENVAAATDARLANGASEQASDPANTLILDTSNEVASTQQKPAQRLHQIRMSIPFAAALAAGCFVAGFIAGSL